MTTETISITNGTITRMIPFGNGFLIEATAGSVIERNAPLHQPALGSKVLNMSMANAELLVGSETAPNTNDQPVGPRDQFTRPWREGDRNPTEAEQWSKPEWYKDFGKNQPAPMTGQPMNVQDIAFVPGGITKIPYPIGNQKRFRITGVVPGPGCFEFTIPQSRAGDGRFSLVGAELDACPYQKAVFSLEAGVFVGPSILAQYRGGNHFSEPFVVNKQGGGGYGPELYASVASYVNIDFSEGVPTNLTCEIAAHNRLK